MESCTVATCISYANQLAIARRVETLLKCVFSYIILAQQFDADTCYMTYMQMPIQ